MKDVASILGFSDTATVQDLITGGIKYCSLSWKEAQAQYPHHSLIYLFLLHHSFFKMKVDKRSHSQIKIPKHWQPSVLELITSPLSSLRDMASTWTPPSPFPNLMTTTLLLVCLSFIYTYLYTFYFILTTCVELGLILIIGALGAMIYELQMGW